MLWQTQPLVVDYTKEESFKQIIPGSPILSSPKLAWEGIGAFHYYRLLFKNYRPKYHFCEWFFTSKNHKKVKLANFTSNISK